MQIKLMLLSERLKLGDAIVISREDMIKAAEGNLSSLLFDSVRESDIKEFASQIQENWGVRMTEHENTGDYTMIKVGEC